MTALKWFSILCMILTGCILGAVISAVGNGALLHTSNELTGGFLLGGLTTIVFLFLPVTSQLRKFHMHWILQNNLFNEDAYQVLLDTLVRFDIPHSIHKVIPFIGELYPEVELPTKNVICMGSYSLRHSAKKFGWVPGVFDLEPFNFKVQLEHWGEHMLNHDAVISSFDDANFEDDIAFVRPIEDSKVFACAVFDKADFYDWKRKVCVLEHDYGNLLTKHTLVQVCRPKKIYSEHRFWVVAAKIVTSSTYKVGDSVRYETLIDPRFETFAQERIDEWQPLDSFVIDVCECEEGLKVVEINTINSSGFYAADIQKLVTAFEEAYSDRD